MKTYVGIDKTLAMSEIPFQKYQKRYLSHTEYQSRRWFHETQMIAWMLHLANRRSDSNLQNKQIICNKCSKIIIIR